MVHHWVQTGEIRCENKRFERMLAKAIQATGINRLELWPEGGEHEGAIAIQVDGHGYGVSRDDTPREGWITGHFDYQYWMLDGELWIDDLKTGKWYPNPPKGDLRNNPELAEGENRFPQNPLSTQIKTYALGLSELLEYRGGVNVSVTHWPRLPTVYRHRAPQRIWGYWTHQALMQHWNDLETLYWTYRHNTGDLLVPGDHCRFCPARSNCFAAKEFDDGR